MRTSMSRTVSSISSSTTFARTGARCPTRRPDPAHSRCVADADRSGDWKWSCSLPEEAVRGLPSHQHSPYPQQSVGQLPALWRDRLQAELRDDGHWVQLRLSDNGPGIAEGTTPGCSSPSPRAMWRTGGGSGLGLAIVAKIVSQHHGTIRLGRSELGACR